MSQISLRVDRNLKEAAYDQLKNLGVTPSDFFRDMLEYVVRENKLPVRRELISDEDADLLAMVKRRLKQPEKLKKVSFDELLQS
ncbi:addiction module antitoxin, RelB/DinJ family (plasmid) [Zymomonas mobilis subsp. mobilis NCIMB 11163]|uniref:type II toxin-antitoxin system RelB/DinJ family antitoxin n=1 Tax=Zymomonas mobilis TaxID=542 RepID=UPI0001B7067D|nr:type II toxin-antitoxin system RelB/DinJ family antitoxin [Zymomonas mobilis]ACV76422.1 addiction module antitoxin, RelB/DinJ family [Zymomonas mobilis subsp. mobilis NCIMB 11163]